MKSQISNIDTRLRIKIKTLLLLLLTSSFALINVNASEKDPIEICSNLSASIRIIATQRDSGADYKNLEANHDLYKLEKSGMFSAQQVLDVVEKTSFLRANVLSNAFANVCMSKDKLLGLNSEYYKQFEGCNPYTENEELVFKCVTNIVSF